ncbi:3-octaprenyl-4-hydroxybenzoate carboxy-lyase [bacterium BMS3Bbin05]|nr:3-octaprenyl-4-hydroxybenzoate carboxy-lyase [bacterium BMS3Bbin05]HDL20839.1 menaquinone biosynthesis decarboxylase [Nitrospirota bacterium]
MAYKDLTDFIDILEKRGLLKRIRVEVDPILEISEITDRMCKSPGGGKALFFEKVKSSRYPVVTNLFGSFERMSLSLEVDKLDDIATRIEELLNQAAPKTLMEKLAMLPKLFEFSKYLPKPVKKAPCQEVIEKSSPDLSRFPIIKCWPADGQPTDEGRFITLPMVFTKDPETGRQNCGMYRIHIYDKTTTGMHWHIHKDGARHYDKYKELNQKMPAAIAVGSDPAIIYSASAPLPGAIDEMLFAGFLGRKPVEMVRCITSDIEVPANSELVIEGYLEPGEMRIEGPFGDHTGFYSAADYYPVFHVTCITHRKNMIYPATLVGKPPMEDYYMGKATERIFLPLIRLDLPEIKDINLPMEGIFHNAALISIKKSFPGHAKKIIHGLWGKGQMMFAKLLIVVDEDVDVQDISYTAWRVLNNVDWKRDVVIADGPLDDLDHSASWPRYGSKMGIDATRKTREEGMTRDWPDELFMSEEIKKLVDSRWKEYGFEE